MTHREVRLTDEAIRDIDNAVQFYEGIEDGLGSYFFDSVLADVKALEFFGGLHQKRFDYYACPAKRFPFFIYYDVRETDIDVIAVLDTRADPEEAEQRFSN